MKKLDGRSFAGKCAAPRDGRLMGFETLRAMGHYARALTDGPRFHSSDYEREAQRMRKRALREVGSVTERDLGSNVGSERDSYLFLAERIRDSPRENYQRVVRHKRTDWGVSYFTPTPKWLDSAIEVIELAIELSQREEGFRLFIEGNAEYGGNIELNSFSRRYRKIRDEVLRGYFADKRAK